QDYLVPLAFVSGAEAEAIARAAPQSIVARIKVEAAGLEGLVCDATARPGFARVLCEAVQRRRSFGDGEARLRAFSTSSSRTAEQSPSSIEPSLLRDQRSNTTFQIGDKYFLKLFRRVESGTNPELELERFLNEKGFPNVPKL